MRLGSAVAFVPSGCSPRFSGGGTFTAIGPGAALLQHRAPLWERRPRRDFRGAEPSRHRAGGGPPTTPRPPCRSGALAAIFGRRNLHGIGPGAALLQHRAPLWERRPRRDFRVAEPSRHRAGGGPPTRARHPGGSGALAAIFGRRNLHGIGPGAALLQHRAPLWERRPRRDFRVAEPSRHRAGGGPPTTERR